MAICTETLNINARKQKWRNGAPGIRRIDLFRRNTKMQQEVRMETRSNRLLIFVIIFLLAAGCLVGCGKKAPEAEAPMVVQAEKVQAGAHALSYTYAGDVRGRYESQFAFQASGRIRERLVSNGDSVKAGQALMQMDTADLKTQLDKGRASMVAAQSDYELSQVTFLRYQELAKQEVVSKEEFDRVASQNQVSLAKLRSAEADYVEATQKFGYGTLTSDADGIVADIKVEAGQVVNAGQQALTLVRTGEVEIQINVPEQRVDDIRKAKKISVTFWALPELELAGVIREVSQLADSSTRTYMVRISIPQNDRVRFGMSATVKIWAGDSNGLVVLPVAAIYQTGDKPHVWVVEKDALRLQSVELGNFVADGVVIKSGLKPEDTVVTAGVQKLQEGQKVKVWDGRKI